MQTLKRNYWTLVFLLFFIGVGLIYGIFSSFFSPDLIERGKRQKERLTKHIEKQKILFRDGTEALENETKAVLKAVEKEDPNWVLQELARYAAEKNLLFKDKQNETSFEIELNGNFSDVLAWFAFAESNFYLSRVTSIAWEVLANGDIQAKFKFDFLKLERTPQC